MPDCPYTPFLISDSVRVTVSPVTFMDTDTAILFLKVGVPQKEGRHCITPLQYPWLTHRPPIMHMQTCTFWKDSFSFLPKIKIFHFCLWTDCFTVGEAGSIMLQDENVSIIWSSLSVLIWSWNTFGCLCSTNLNEVWVGNLHTRKAYQPGANI